MLTYRDRPGQLCDRLFEAIQKSKADGAHAFGHQSMWALAKADDYPVGRICR